MFITLKVVLFLYQEQQVMMETLKGKEFYEGDNPLEELSINGDSESDEDFLGSEENCIVERVSIIMFSHY